ncbi:MAG: hypothetical protein FWH29_01870 [Methanobrevibacter sp.]|nr:hypothetical protein [Methanobrevibacter sp.]
MTIFNWKDYYKLAHELANYDSPAKKRTSISRAYYGSFISCRNFLLENKLFLGRNSKKIMESESPNVHKEVYEIFKKYHYMYNMRKANFYSKNLVGKKISSWLSDLRRNRNKADYNNEFEKLDDYTHYSLIRSGEILNILNSFK